MIARIRAKGGAYDSVVFAIYHYETYSEALVFDREGTSLKRERFFTRISHRLRINIFIFDTKAENWVERDGEEGYDWLLGRESDEKVFARCKELQAQICVPEWFELKDSSDVEGLISATTGLHDAYVKKIYQRGEKHFIRFAAWSCEVLFELTGNFETNLCEGYGNMPIGDDYPLIGETSVFFEDGKVCWTDYEEAKSFSDRDKFECAYFLAEKIRWKFTLTNKG